MIVEKEKHVICWWNAEEAKRQPDTWEPIPCIIRVTVTGEAPHPLYYLKKCEEHAEA